MKLTVSGVTFSAAQMKSPSFSGHGLDGLFDR
jgi:hypothetical protein